MPSIYNQRWALYDGAPYQPPDQLPEDAFEALQAYLCLNLLIVGWLSVL